MNENGNECRKEEEDVEHCEEQLNVAPEDKIDFTVPRGYWYSYRFVGSMLAIMLLANNLFIGYSMPANVIGIIDADLGVWLQELFI
ncbi:siderophore iron transporter [Fusarium albosuccineum]|uniref:Siderophore iron transporter n=1 Tax=Fusarium albosuccineum TaxID=1237068 RepID=A0A8H4LKX9_9HYPO|nr:siderophore iron transporter [Fusarium albosuccineum]